MPIFTAMLFTIAKGWKQPKCPSASGSKTMVHLHNRILHSRKKKGAPMFRDSVDGTGEYHVK